MKTLHQALMGVMMIAILAAAVGVIQPWAPTAEAQHGQHGAAGEPIDPQEHFAAWAAELELSAPQREVLAPTFIEGFAAMAELQRIHGAIVGELNDIQKEKFAKMVGGMMGGPTGEHGEHGQHGQHEGGGHQ